MPKTYQLVAVLASTAAAGFGGAVIAGAADSANGTTPKSTTPSQYGPGGHGGFGRGHGGPGRGAFGADLAAIAKTLGVTEAKLKSALEAARPGKPSGTKDRRGAEIAAALAKELGERTADVQSVLEGLRPTGMRGAKPSGTTPDRPTGTTPGGGPRGGHRGHGGGPGGPGFKGDDTALVAALAKKFSISTAKAQAAVDAVRKAHQSDHEAKADERYAAIAKALGKSADDVEKAFEANRPKPPVAPTTP